MFQQGTKNLFVNLPKDDPQMQALAAQFDGLFDDDLSQWKFSNTHKKIILTDLVKPESESESESESDGDDLTKSPTRMDKRLHRAQSFSRFESESESESDQEDFKLNLDHKVRKKLSAAQFDSKRNKISQSIENCKYESATTKLLDSPP